MFVRWTAFLLAMALLLSSSAFSQSERSASNVFTVKVFEREDNRWQSRDVILSFDVDRITLRTLKDYSQTESIRYSEIKGAEYSHSMGNRTISSATALAANIFAFPLMMRKMDEHWLTLESPTHQTFLNLERDNYQDVVAAFQSKVGWKVAGWDVTSVAGR